MGCEHGVGPKCDNCNMEHKAEILLDALRSSTLDTPNGLDFNVFHSFSMEGLTDRTKMCTC
jgi:hypothetical protein